MADQILDDHGLEVIRKAGKLDDDNNYRIRTEAESTPAGLRESIRITTLEITDTASLLPATALTNRNSMEIYNTDTSNSIWIGPSNSVTADCVVGTTSGKEISSGSYWNIDITDDIVLYGIAKSGNTVKIQVMEVA